jgi:hypothetical protein
LPVVAVVVGQELPAQQIKLAGLVVAAADTGP